MIFDFQLRITYTGASLILEKLFSRFSVYGIAFFSIYASGSHLDATNTSENILRRSSMMISYLTVDTLCKSFSCFKGLFR